MHDDERWIPQWLPSVVMTAALLVLVMPVVRLASAQDTSAYSFRASRLVARAMQAAGSKRYAIWEYHDQQRLTADDGDAYGPIVRAFALETTVTDDISRFETTGPRPVALVLVETESTPIPVAYSNLGLEYGLNCVWLVHSHGTATDAGWRALAYKIPGTDNISGPDPIDASCPDLSTIHPKQAAVVAIAPRVAGVPPVARFGEMKASSGKRLGRSLLGIKCAVAWCFIGTESKSAVAAPGHVSVTPPSNPSAPAGSPQWNNYGWFDEQSLAVPVSTAPHHLKPIMRATTIPDVSLQYLSIGSFEQEFQLVARIRVTNLDSKYAKWNFKPGWNMIWLYRDPSVTDPDKGWKMAVTPNTKTVPTTPNADIEVTRHSHMSNVIATARWTWFDTDEALWVACDAGCCQGRIKFSASDNPGNEPQAPRSARKRVTTASALRQRSSF